MSNVKITSRGGVVRTTVTPSTPEQLEIAANPPQWVLDFKAAKYAERQARIERAKPENVAARKQALFDAQDFPAFKAAMLEYLGIE